MDAVPAAGLAGTYGVSMQVAYAALAMLAANKYVSLVRGLTASLGTPSTVTCERGLKHRR